MFNKTVVNNIIHSILCERDGISIEILGDWKGNIIMLVFMVLSSVFFIIIIIVVTSNIIIVIIITVDIIIAIAELISFFVSSHTK